MPLIPVEPLARGPVADQRSSHGLILLKKLLPYLRPYWWRVAWALAQVFLIAGFELLKPWPLQVVIDNVLGGKPFPLAVLAPTSPTGLLLLACLGIIAVHLGAGVLTLLHNYTTIGVGQRMVNDLRGALYAHLQRLSLAFHSRQRVGDLLYRITADSFAVQTMIMNGVLPILSATRAARRDACRPAAARSDIDAVVADGCSLVVWPDFRVQPKDRRYIATEVRTTESRVYSVVQWAMSSIKLVQAFTKEDEEHQRFMGASGESLRAPCGSTAGRRSIRERSIW